MSIYRKFTQQPVRWLRHIRHFLTHSNAAFATDKHALPIDEIGPTFSAISYTRLSAMARLVVCISAMQIPFFYAAGRQHPLFVPFAVLWFSIYAIWLYWQTVRNNMLEEHQIFYWIDTLWYLLFTGITGGSTSHFSFFLSFPLLFVSLRWGFTAGITLAVFSSSVLLAIVMPRTGATDFSWPVANILLPPVALLTLGYLMATGADSGLILNRRLAAMKEINSLFNPRHTIEQMIDRVARHLVKLYQADKYVSLVVEAGRPPRAFRANLPDSMYRLSDAAAFEITNLLSGLEAEGAVIYRASRGLLPAEVYCSSTPDTTEKRKKCVIEATAIAARFNCSGFGSVQYNLRQGGIARLFVCSDERSFTAADLPFFHQIGEQLSPLIENAQLLDCLANVAAEQERQKISRDMHDSAIQPYIGLKYGLEALAHKAGVDDPLSNDIGRLVDMATTEIIELRRYVKGLRDPGEYGRAALVPAVRRQAASFSEFYGIKVDVNSAEVILVDDDIANEAFHIVSEALSNIRRHTTASFAHINLSCERRQLRLQISNPCDSGTPAKLFKPLSIAERTLALGGSWQVEISPNSETVVSVILSLHT